MIVDHLEECLFNLFAYFKIVLFCWITGVLYILWVLSHYVNISSYSASNFLLILSVFTCMHGCFISSSFT